MTESKPVAPGRGHGERILYLDDDDALVSLISRSLERLGYRVTAFTDQEEALRHFAAAPQEADVFVTDYNMPGLSGLDVARKVLEIRPGMPVLLISGYVTEALVHTAKQVGVRQVLEKPDGVAALTKGVDAALKA